MADSNVAEDSNSGYSIVCSSDEQSSLSSESRASVKQQLPEIEASLPVISSTLSGLTERITSTESSNGQLPMDLNDDKQGAATDGQPPTPNVQHKMMDIAEIPTPPPEGESTMEVSSKNVDSEEITDDSVKKSVGKCVPGPEGESTMEVSSKGVDSEKITEDSVKKSVLKCVPGPEGESTMEVSSKNVDSDEITDDSVKKSVLKCVPGPEGESTMEVSSKNVDSDEITDDSVKKSVLKCVPGPEGESTMEVSSKGVDSDEITDDSVKKSVEECVPVSAPKGESTMEVCSKSVESEKIPDAAVEKSVEGRIPIPAPVEEVAVENPFEGISKLSSKTREIFEEIDKHVRKEPYLRHVHYRNEKCDCLPIKDCGGVLYPHRAQTRAIEKITRKDCYVIKIDVPEFSRGDINVMIVDKCKLSIDAKRDADTNYGNECHEFHKILKLPKDADISRIKSELTTSGQLSVTLRRMGT